MSDFVFFPVAALIGALCVYIAMQPFNDRLPTGPISGGSEGSIDIVVDGENLYRFRAGGPGRIRIGAGEGGETLMRITREADDIYQDPRSGPHLILAQDIESAFQNQAVQVEIVARAAGDFGASAIEVNYFAKPGSESGWRSYDLTPEFQTFVLNWRPPRFSGVNGYDYLGVRPVAPNKRRSVDVKSVRLRPAGSAFRAE